MDTVVNDIKPITKHCVGNKKKKEYDEAMKLFGLAPRLETKKEKL